MTNKTIKFKDVPIGAKFKHIKNKFIKLSNEKAYVDYDSECWDKVEMSDDIEVELITKCENCKNIDVCNIRKLVNKDYFSCSLFEEKPDGK